MKRAASYGGRSLVLAALCFATLVAAASPAAAHADFLGSNPADGEVVEGPLESVALRFSAPVEPALGGFELLVNGVEVDPAAEPADGGAVWIITTREPLVGEIGVRWSVKAPDAHPISGTFSFRVIAAPASASSTSAPPDTVAPPSEELEEFLEAPTPSWPSRLGHVGRLLAFVAALSGVGLLVFSWRVMVGAGAEFGQLFQLVRAAGLTLIAGALVDLIGVVSRHDDLAAALAGLEGLAVAMRVLGGGALMVMGLMPVPLAGQPEGRGSDEDRFSWRPAIGAAAPLTGAVVIVISFSLDGHTSSEGWRPAMVVADVVHVMAAAVWVGGIVGLAAVATRRRGEVIGQPVAMLAGRFSWYATLALVAVGATGAAMAFAVLDGPGEMWSTDWGRWLLVKLALVAAAAGCGAYNRFFAIPAASRDEGGSGNLAAVLRTESLVLVAAAAVTGLLVVAAT